jgi:hypothetical protein
MWAYRGRTSHCRWGSHQVICRNRLQLLRTYAMWRSPCWEARNHLKKRTPTAVNPTPTYETFLQPYLHRCWDHQRIQWQEWICHLHWNSNHCLIVECLHHRLPARYQRVEHCHPGNPHLLPQQHSQAVRVALLRNNGKISRYSTATCPITPQPAHTFPNTCENKGCIRRGACTPTIAHAVLQSFSVRPMKKH